MYVFLFETGSYPVVEDALEPTYTLDLSFPSPFASVPQVRGLLAYATVSSSNAVLKDLNAWHNSLSCLGITNLPLSWGQNIFPVLVTLQSCLLLSLLLALPWLGVPVRFCCWLLSPGVLVTPGLICFSEALSVLYINIGNIWFPTQRDAFLRVC